MSDFTLRMLVEKITFTDGDKPRRSPGELGLLVAQRIADEDAQRRMDALFAHGEGES